METRHPEYKTIEARLRSFTNWPQDMRQSSDEIAEAGFYYTGSEDQVRCFACDGGLRRWDPEDDPWTEHCRWFPACKFALEQKGEQFIAQVQASVQDQTYGANGVEEQDISSAMELLRLKESAFEAVLNEHKTECLEMGYEEDLLKKSIHEMLDKGIEKPSLEDIIDFLETIKEEEEEQIKGRSYNALESLREENRSLKVFVNCIFCCENKKSALFLPCQHNKLCMRCAEPLIKCPFCQKGIQSKIRTYMVSNS